MPLDSESHHWISPVMRKYFPASHLAHPCDQWAANEMRRARASHLTHVTSEQPMRWASHLAHPCDQWAANARRISQFRLNGDYHSFGCLVSTGEVVLRKVWLAVVCRNVKVTVVWRNVKSGGCLEKSVCGGCSDNLCEGCSVNSTD